MTNRTPRDRLRTLRLLGALAGLSVALGACTYTGAEVVDGERARRLPAAPSDRGPGSRYLDRRVRRAGARRPVRFAARRRHGTGANLGSRRHRRDRGRCARRHAERPGRGVAFQEIQANAGGGRRADARRQAESLPSGRSPHARDHQAELPENLGGRRSLRPVAGGSRAVESSTRAIAKTGSITISVVRTSATSPR